MDHQFLFSPTHFVIRCEPLADLGADNPDRRIDDDVVIESTTEQFIADSSLSEIFKLPVKSTLDDEAKKVAVALAAMKQIIGEYPLQLPPDAAWIGG